ncbi:hypothetical protein MAR_020121 [Mya arenaria]|uniref:Uncharacterized protein n=1 Tax=Mya arenaria TaxID=6604 RepID=A0ABY7E7I6_MYAAR|nr:hypothetical protein MAR_020121 [Mya arenaria]
MPVRVNTWGRRDPFSGPKRWDDESSSSFSEDKNRRGRPKDSDNIRTEQYMYDNQQSNFSWDFLYNYIGPNEISYTAATCRSNTPSSLYQRLKTLISDPNTERLKKLIIVSDPNTERLKTLIIINDLDTERLKTLIIVCDHNTERLKTLISDPNTERLKTLISYPITKRLKTLISDPNTERLKTLIIVSDPNTERLNTLIIVSDPNTERLKTLIIVCDPNTERLKILCRNNCSRRQREAGIIRK